MGRFLRRLLGREEGFDTEPARSFQGGARSKASDATDDSRGYFELLGKLQSALSGHDYRLAARLTRESLQQLPALVRQTKGEYGAFDIQSIPALQHGGTAMALVGDRDGLRQMREVVESTPELRQWMATVRTHEKDMMLFDAILEAVAENPGCLQTSVKDLVSEEDGRRVANLISWLEKAGKLARRKEGRSYSLVIAESGNDTPPPPPRRIASHRTDRHSPSSREIDIDTLPYVPLPKAPQRWEAKQGHRRLDAEASEWFEIRDAEAWELTSMEKIPPDERPDPAFRRIHPTNAGLFMVDDLGNSLLSGSAPASALSYGREGTLLAQAPLLHDPYRIGVNAMGDSLIAMSKDCVVHAYDSGLKAILETSLRESPEVRALQDRLLIGEDDLRNHIRCVAISFDRSRYLFTGVDEAWCVSIDGRCLWGARLPITEGWKRIGEPSSGFGTSAEVDNALKAMSMTLPFTPEDFKARYRELVKEWHPDLNPENPDALRRMQEINVSAEILSGLDQRAIPRYARAVFGKDLRTADVRVGDATFTITMGIQMSELQAADWVYAANFAGASHEVFLAGYSGRIVHLSQDGEPIRAYDIGAVPRRIADTGDYLYFLTDTRHYTLQGDALVAITDTSEGGDLLVAQTGFGLLEKKRFRWFREDGVHLGTVMTRNPIRRVYHTSGGMVAETRQRRGVIGGVGSWWE